MGTDKALLRLHPGGPTLIEAVAARLTEADLRPTLLITNRPDNYAWLGIPMFPDDVPGGGALGGILTALTHSTHQRTLVVACDMPLLSPPLLRYMASLPGEADAIVPRWTDEEGRTHVETLHAIYSTRCIEPIRRRIGEGKLKVADALSDFCVRYLSEEECRRYDPHLLSFRNVNTPGDFRGIVRDQGSNDRR